MDKLCPMKFKIFAVDKNYKPINMNAWKCEQENCAWWIEKDGLIRCAIKELATR